MAQLIIGLGNRGGEYARTRHNVGWMCLEELERRGRFGRERREGPAKVRSGLLDGYEVMTARPQTYMNLSGKAGVHLTDKLGVPPHDVIVVHDDADLPLGRLRLRRGGSAAGQKGVQSLMDSWRTQDFIRVRIGIGHPDDGGDLVEHVLDRFEPSERPLVDEVIRRAADAVVTTMRDGLEAAMTQFNRAPAG
jgi:peptidyl-tRNA hydrolase, PTH1 family